jgi:glutamyl-tRNA reductase
VDTLSELVLVGLSHRTAPVAVREQYAVKPEDLEGCLRGLVAGEILQEAVVLSTCNRTEALVLATGTDAVEAVRRRLFRNIADEHLYTYRGVHAVMHVLRVACGLDSLVLGESEVLAQTRRAFETARSAGTAGKLLDPLGKQALETGKRVRNETELGQGTLSVARVAVDVVHHAFGSLHDNHALIVGAGETGLLVAKHLRDEGIRRLDFANRTTARAEEAAHEYGGRSFGLDQLADAAAGVDVVVVCVDGAPSIIDHAALDLRRLSRRDQPLLVIDLSMPRAVAPDLSGQAGLLLYDLDDLQPVVERNRRARGEASRASADILVAEVHKFLSLRTYAAFSPAISDLRLRFGGLREEVLDRVTAGKATPRELELAHELGKQLLDLALEQMKEGARRSRSTEALGREYDRFLEGL